MHSILELKRIWKCVCMDFFCHIHLTLHSFLVVLFSVVSLLPSCNSCCKKNQISLKKSNDKSLRCIEFSWYGNVVQCYYTLRTHTRTHIHRHILRFHHQSMSCSEKVRDCIYCFSISFLPHSSSTFYSIQYRSIGMPYALCGYRMMIQCTRALIEMKTFSA